MKQNNFLSMALIAVLMVMAVGCTTMQGVQDDGYYDTRTAQNATSRVYVEEPYRPGRTILMERDPFTGRYYEVNPYGNIYNQGYSTYPAYDPRYNNRQVYRDRRYDNRRNNNTYPSRGQVYQQPQQSPEQRREIEKRKEAKDAVLGKKN